MVHHVLVAYASKHGSTAGIAERIGAALREEGLDVDVLPAKAVDDLAVYTAVVLGSAVYIGRWQKPAARLLQIHEGTLAGMPVWISSSGPTGQGEPLELTQGWRLPGKLQPVVGRIAPRDVAVFHGALSADRLGFLEKWIINNVKAPLGDFRDWQAITRWAKGIAGVLREVDPAPPTRAA